MTASPMNAVLRRLRKSILVQDAAETTDGNLLEAFISRKDEAAFEALLRRHGPMVLGVCLRVLHNLHDAEDAFQATFLVLVRKAASVRPRAMVGNWLHGVAYRTALKANETTARRKLREGQMAAKHENPSPPHDAWLDLQPLLDEELSRLPDNYRLPIVLCDLENKSIKEATRQLGWPQGTLAGRLARARKMLAKRLSQRGVVLSGGALALMLSQKTASACVAPTLVDATIKAQGVLAAGKTAAMGVISVKVAVLMKGVLQGMMLTKLKTMLAMLIVLCAVGVGGGMLVRHLAAGQESRADEKTAVNQVTQKKDRSPRSLDESMLHGEWLGDEQKIGKFSFIFGPGGSLKRLSEIDINGATLGTYSVDWNKTPHHLDMKWDGGLVHKCIMEFGLDGKLRIEENADLDGSRPQKFKASAILLTKKEATPAGTKQADADAARDLDQAEFYRRTEKYRSAHFYYELMRRRYPGTDFARKAAQGIEDLKKLRFVRPDGTEGWESDDAEPKQVQPPPKVMHITQTEAERLLAQALGEKNDMGRMSIKILSPSMFVASNSVVVEKDGRARFEPFRAILFGMDKNATLIISERAIVTLDRPIEKTSDLGSRTIVSTQFSGVTETRTVQPKLQEDKVKAVVRVGQIIVVGNQKTPTSAILKLVPIYPGEVLDYQALPRTEKNLAEFRATVTVSENIEGGFRDILIKIQEK